MKLCRNGAPAVIMSNPFGKAGYFGWPSISLLQNGKIAVVASGYRHAHICPFGKAVISFSEDGGKSWADLPADCVVSMNLWGFTPAYVQEAKAGFAAFLQASLPVNPMKCEYYLPTVVTNALEAGKADVHVLTSADKWHGITYREDKPELVEALKKMSEDGLYPVDRLF